MSVPWVLAGSAACSGVAWLALAALRYSGLDTAAILLAAAAGGLASGAMIANHAPVRAQREPLLAGVLGLALVAGATYAIAPGATSSAWVLISALALGGAGGFGGAELIRRTKRVSISSPSVLLLSAAVHVGVLISLFSLSGDPASKSSWLVVASFGGVALSAFVTQLAVPRRAPWTCAGGIALLPAINYAYESRPGNLGALIAGTLVLWLVGRLGSGLANRIFVRDGVTDLPEARTN